MFFLLKKILPQLFISIILNDKKSILKASIYKNDKLISSNEKSFSTNEKLLDYVKNLCKKFLFYNTSLLLDAKEQGLIPSKNEQDFKHFNIGNMSVKYIHFNNASVYTATEHVEYFNELFEDYKGLDFLYSPFALLYYCVLRQKIDQEKIILYAYRYKQIVAIIICQNNRILYGDLKFFEEELELEFESQESTPTQSDEITNNDTEVTLENFNETLDDKIDLLDEDNEVLLNEDNNTNTSLEELNQFSNDMELSRYIITSIEKFYNDDKYSGTFINNIYVFNENELSPSAIEFLENETFLEVKSEQINTLELMIELMQKEVK